MIDLDSLDGIDIINKSANKISTTTATRTATLIPAHNPGHYPASSATALSSMSDGKDANLLTCMLITANVGTIFEEPDLLELWFQQLKSYLTKVRPQLVAIHCQEVGGKNYESSMKYVANFTDKIIGDQDIISDYSRVRIFLDESFESLDKFTALGSLYLVHDSVNDVKLYNFKTAQYDCVEGKKIFAGDTTNASAQHVEKIKFPQELFPECRWSRKGFMRTRWLFNQRQPLDLVNIHLFHDASNLVAMKSTPSPYAQHRQRALEFALDTLKKQLEGTWTHIDLDNLNTSTTTYPEVPLFIFGDFNFRLDTNKVIQRITDGVSPIVKKEVDSEEVLEFIYHRRRTSSSQHDQDMCKNLPNNVQCCSSRKKIPTNESISTMTDSELEMKRKDDGNSNYIDASGVVMTVGKKLFDCENLDQTFRATENTEWLLEMDNELDNFKSKLFEFEIVFSPSYPFKEDTSGAYSYMKTRCPAWCDRILFNAAGSKLIHRNDDSDMSSSASPYNKDEIICKDSLPVKGSVMYRLMGNSVPMGDHKPVLLYCTLNLSHQKTTDALQGTSAGVD